MEDSDFDPVAKQNIDAWLSGNYDAETKAAIRELMRTNPRELIDAFYTNLSFGTGGLRGIMGPGTNRMNIYTVAKVTQGLANYLKQQPVPELGYAVFIGYDSRHQSRTFAEEAAKVLAGNGIKVFLFHEMRPTPLVSFGCRFKKCSAAIAITASHNPPEYNGYKVYWNDGGQVLPPHDQGIIEEASRIKDLSMVRAASRLSDPLITLVGSDIDDAYMSAVYNLQLYPEDNTSKGNALKIVYTSLHGTGITVLPKMLNRWGFTSIDFVDSQIIPDGNFPTTKSPNPEDASALSLGIERLKLTEADLLIATDPDADRVGVAIRHSGEAVIISGNQLACVCLKHICEGLFRQNRLPEKGAFIKTIVTTELFQAIANSYHRLCVNVLTGFKYIAEKIRLWKQDSVKGYEFIFGGEESYGYLLGTETRDKDGILASALICEVALQAKLQGKTLLDLVHDLWREYGVYVDKTVSIHFKDTKEGRELIVHKMNSLFNDVPTIIGGIDVHFIDDYRRSVKTDLQTGEKRLLFLPKSNVLTFWLMDGSKIMVRPSGTEPKIKLYCGVRVEAGASIASALEIADKQAEAYLSDIKSLFK